MERFAQCAVLCGTESVESVQALLRGCHFNETLMRMEGSAVQIGGQALRVRSFILVDHMLQYKATGASGPGSILSHRQSCPYCGAPPDEALNWRSQPMALETAPLPGAPLQAVPRDQCIPDAMHGVQNVLHNVVMAAVKALLMDKGSAA